MKHMITIVLIGTAMGRIHAGEIGLAMILLAAAAVHLIALDMIDEGRRAKEKADG